MNKAFSPTVMDVLKRPLFQHAEVVAGSRGLARPIRWAHILETPEGTPFLNGGEIILSTGAGFAQDSRKRQNYLLELIEREAAALCIELGTYMPAIPLDMKDLAEHHDFPLIAFSQPVRFVDITLDLHETIVFRHVQALRELETYSRHIQQLTLESQGIRQILHTFQEAAQSQAFFLHYDQTAIYAPAMSQGMQNEMTDILQQHLLKERCQERGSIPISGQKQILFQPISAMGHVFAYLGVILYEREPDHFLYLTLDYTASSIAQLLLRKMFAEERFLDYQNRVLDDILQDKIPHEEQIRAQLGIRKSDHYSPSYASVIMELQNEGKHQYKEETSLPFDDLQVIYRSILTRYGFRILFRSKGYRLYMLIIQSHAQGFFREQLKKALAELDSVSHKALGTPAEIRVGVGRIDNQYGQAHLHFQEAEQVLSFTSGLSSPFFDDLGVFRLLLQVDNGYAIHSFIEDYIGPLINDPEQGSDLLLTLKIFLESNLSKQEAAQRLFIRRQSLYLRLEKIEDALGKDYLSPHRRLCLELAIRAYEWLGKDISLKKKRET